MKIEITTSIHNNVFKRNRNMVLDAIKSFNGKDVVISFDKPKKKRSNNQNSYYHGLLVPLMQQGAKDLWGEVWSRQKAHEHLKAKFCFHERVIEKTGEIERVPKSTTENTTTEMEVFHLEIRMYLLENFDIDAPEPNEDLTLKI